MCVYTYKFVWKESEWFIRHRNCLLELTRLYAQVSTDLNEPDSGTPHGEGW